MYKLIWTQWAGWVEREGWKHKNENFEMWSNLTSDQNRLVEGGDPKVSMGKLGA